MSLIADALQPFTVRGLIGLRGRGPEGHWSTLLVDGFKAGYDVDADDADKSVLIDFRESQYVLTALAADASRFSCAAFQSIQSAPSDLIDKEVLPWGLVKLYYAAFYAGHAIIRLLGETCSYFERKQTNKLSALLDLYGRTPSFTVDAGYYHCSVTSSVTGVKMVRTTGAGLGGSHELFWDIFGKRVVTVASSVLSGPLPVVEAQDVFLKLEAFRKITSCNGAFGDNWLSVIRNQLQYRHGLGAWYPTSLRKPERETLSRLAAQWERDPMRVDLSIDHTGEIGRFVIGCAFTVATCRTILLRIAERSEAGERSFVKLGPLAYLSKTDQ
jgi:hypothetical protein